MNRITYFLVGMALLLSASLGFGQTILTNTTLSAAASDSLGRVVTVASATGINAPSSSDNTKATLLYVDRELMDVTAVSGTNITVRRGAGSTIAQPHASSAYVFVVPTYLSSSFVPIPHGSCTRANEPVLPRINFREAVFSDCLGGLWVSSRPYQGSYYPQPNGLRIPDPGATALTALETSGTAAGASTEIYCSEIDLPQSMMITGLGVLNGTTVGTNKHFAILYDSGGKVLANTAVAGTTTANASTYQKMAFVSKYYAVGPARYFACDGLNGTTDTIRHAITAVNDNIIGNKITGQTFGTAAAITAPTTFTTALAPYFLVY